MTLYEREKALRKQLEEIEKKKTFISPRNNKPIAEIKYLYSDDPILDIKSTSVTMSSMRAMVDYFESLMREETKLGELL